MGFSGKGTFFINGTVAKKLGPVVVIFLGRGCGYIYSCYFEMDSKMIYVLMYIHEKYD